MPFDAEFYDSFSKYGLPGQNPNPLMLAGEWTNASPPPYNVGTIQTIVAGLTGNGYSIQQAPNGVNNVGGILKTFGASYKRVIGGFRFNSNILDVCGITFFSSGTYLVSVDIETSGALGYRNGYLLSGLVTTGGITSANTNHFVEFDIIFDTSAGQVKVWLDGNPTPVINLTGRNTLGTSFNQIAMVQTCTNTGVRWTYSDLYLHLYLSATTTDTPLLTNPAVTCSTCTADSAVHFTPGAGVLGPAYSVTGNTNAPGANTLYLRRFIPSVNMTINSVNCVPAATNATANFRAVIYGDSSGVPGTLLSSGTQVTGTTSGTILNSALTTPQALTGGTAYWIGFMTDTSVVLSEVDTGTAGSKATVTYSSGAPGTAPAMTTGQPDWIIYGSCTGQAANWPQVSLNPPLGNPSYNTDSNVGDSDLFTMGAIPGTPTVIYSSKVCVYGELSTSGVRTINLQQKSGATTGNGNSPGLSPSTSFGWLTSYFDTDPNTSAAWTVANQNAATAGYDIAT